MERKTLDNVEFRMTDEDNGYLEGYPTLWGVLDSYGDVVVQGAYAKALPEFLSRGFNVQSHNWTYGGLIGYPVEAREDETGLWSRFAFHSTADAQDVRTKLKERKAAGLFNGLSIGFETEQATVLMPDQYAEELPKYLRADRLEQDMARAKKMPKVRVVRGIYPLYEYSPVLTPAVKIAGAVDVRSQADFRGQYLGDGIEEAASIAVLSRLNDRLMWYAIYDILQSDDLSDDEKIAQCQGALAEFATIGGNLLAAIIRSRAGAGASAGDAADSGIQTSARAATELRRLFTDPAAADYAAKRAELKFTAALTTAESAVRLAVAHAASRKQVRALEGRGLGAQTVETLASIQGQIGQLLGERAEGAQAESADTAPDATKATSEADESADAEAILQSIARLRVMQAQGRGYLPGLTTGAKQ